MHISVLLRMLESAVFEVKLYLHHDLFGVFELYANHIKSLRCLIDIQSRVARKKPS